MQNLQVQLTEPKEKSDGEHSLSGKAACGKTGVAKMRSQGLANTVKAKLLETQCPAAQVKARRNTR